MINKPIFLIGFMASGKTKMAKKLANSLQLPFFDLDHIIEKKTNKSITQLFQDLGEKKFRELESNQLRSLSTEIASVISLGGGAVCTTKNIEYINEVGISVYLNVASSILIGRLRMDKADRPLVANLSDEEIGDYVRKKITQRERYYMKANVIVLGKNQTVNRIVALLKQFV